MAYGCTYGQDYGTDSCAVGTFVAGYEANANRNTVWLSKSDDGTISDMAVDRSKEDTDASNTGATYWYTSSGSESARFATFDRVSVAVVLDGVDDTDAFGLITKNAGDPAEWTLVVESGQLDLYIATTRVVRLALPGVSATGQKFLLAWCVRDNPATTGASDAKESLLFAYNYDTGGVDQTTITHADLSPDNDPLIFGALDTSGTAAIPSGYWRQVRVDLAYNTTTQLAEDFISRSATPATTAKTREEKHAPDKASGWGDDGEFAGPVHSIIAAATQAHDMRLVSPLVNIVYRSPETYAGNSTKYTWIDGSLQHFHAQFLHYVPIPPTINKWRAKVHIDVSTSDATVLVGSGDRLESYGHIILAPPPARQFYYHQQTVASGTSGWVTFNVRPIARGDRNGTYFYLALDQGGSESDIIVNALVIEGISDTGTTDYPPIGNISG